MDSKIKILVYNVYLSLWFNYPFDNSISNQYENNE